MEDYKGSSIYKAGLRAKEWGELLMEADTTLRQVADFAFRHDVDVQASLVWKRVAKVPVESEPEAMTLNAERVEGDQVERG